MLSLIKKQINPIYRFIQSLFYYSIFKIKDYKKIKNSEFVFFFPYFHTGGAERVHLNIIQALQPQKCCVIFTHLSATTNFQEQFKQVANQIEINAIRNKKSDFVNKLLVKSISKAINTSKTVKAVFGCNTNYYYSILPFFNNSIKIIDLIHAIEPNDERKGMLIESAALLNCRVVINENAKNDIVDIYKERDIDLSLVDRIKIIGNGVNIDENDLIDFKLKDYERIKIGFLGRWSEEKRPEIFLKVAKRIKKRFPNVEFFMAGTGMKSNLRKINDSGVKFLGEISDENELKNLYKKLNFIMITSVYEGFPMVIMESMIHGVIPICTDVGGIHEHIVHMKNGILIQNTDEVNLIESFENQFTYLIENKDVIERLSQEALNYSVRNFSIDNFNSSYKNLFRSV